MPEMTSGVAGSSWGRGNYGSPGGKDGVLGKHAHAEKWATGLNEQRPAEHDCAPRGQADSWDSRDRLAGAVEAARRELGS